MTSALVEPYWVAGDPAELRALGARWDLVAQQLEVQRRQLLAHDYAMAEAIEGQLAQQRRAGLANVLAALDDAHSRARAVGRALTTVSDIVEQSHHRMRIVDAVATFHGLKSLPTLTPAPLPHHAVAHTMLAAVRADADESLASVAEHREQSAEPEVGGPGGAGPGVGGAAGWGMAGAGMGGLGLGGVGLAGLGAYAAHTDNAARTGDPTGGPGAAAADGDDLSRRAQQLADALPAEVRGYVTIIVGQAITSSGEVVTAMSTSEPDGYLRPGVVPLPNEVVVGRLDGAHAAVRDYFDAIGAAQVVIGATASDDGEPNAADETQQDSTDQGE